MKRNLANFTRGSQLLGHFGFMFAAGLKGPLIIAAVVISATSWWTLSAALTDYEIYLIWMRVYAAIYGFMEFDPDKRVALETVFGGKIELPISLLSTFPPVARAWDHMTEMLVSAAWRSARRISTRPQVSGAESPKAPHRALLPGVCITPGPN